MRNQENISVYAQHKYFKILLSLIFLFALLPPITEAATKITGSGSGWTQGIDSSNLISGAGSDLTGTYQSATNTTTLNVTCGSNFRIWVRRADTLWDNDNFTLYVIRTNNGTSGTGSITSPATGTPVLVTNSNAVFFSGTGSRSGIRVQYQLTGMSVKTAPNNYSTLVTFTITSP